MRNETKRETKQSWPTFAGIHAGPQVPVQQEKYTAVPLLNELLGNMIFCTSFRGSDSDCYIASGVASFTEDVFEED